MATLEEIRSKLLAQQQKSEQGSRGSGGDNASYAFWNIPEGSEAVIRFLPDGDPNNTFFWVERLVIKLPFQGIKGEHDKEIFVQVPCMEMYGETCPILAETRPWWKDPSLQDMARKYWKKKSYLFQGFVVSSPFEEQNKPENIIRRFTINSTIFDIIKNSLMNPDMEELPTHFTEGRDFKLKKTNKGGWANYSSSSWSFKVRGLTDAELSAVQNNGLYNLKDYLPAKPSAEHLNAIKEMFQASVNDEAYDPARWSNFYKPSGYDSKNTTAAKSAVVDDEDDVVETKAAPVAPASASAALSRLKSQTKTEETPQTGNSTDKAKEILARLKQQRG
jgi:hypothetical protein